VSELIVRGALVRVAEDLARLLRLLEFLFGVAVVRIPVRMKLHRQATIRFLDLRFGRVLRYVEYLVVVALCHAHLFGVAFF